MGIYTEKEFLTFDDVAEYLTDKGVYDFDLSNERAWQKLKDLLIEWVRNEKVKPVVYFNSVFYVEKYKLWKIIDTTSDYYDGYVVLGKYPYLEIAKKECLEGEIIDLEFTNNNKKHATQVIAGFDFYLSFRDNGVFRDFTAEKEYGYKLYPLALDKNKTIQFNDILYPKSQLDEIFSSKAPAESNFGTPTITIVQPTIETLNERIKDRDNQITALNERIAELEKRLTISATPNATIEMQVINEVYHQFWANHSSDKIPPKKDTIVDWIKQEYGLSKRIAEAIDSIVRPEQYRQGGQKAR